MDIRPRIGFALCGSFCTFESVMEQMEKLVSEGFELFPILSEKTAQTDTRFGSAAGLREKIREICGREAIDSFTGVERLGPENKIDAIVVAPCTGATLGKLAHGITDSTVAFAVKGCLRNDRPVIIALSTNDALAGSAANIGSLLARRGYYFVPFGQDDPEGKPRSCTARFELLGQTVNAALQGRQLQPILR